MYWVYWTRIFSWKNQTVQAKLVEPRPDQVRTIFKLRGPAQDETYGPELKLTYQINEKHPKPDNYFENYGFTLYSAKLVEVMRLFEVKAEYFPVALVDKKGNDLAAPYFVFHSLEGVQPAMDKIQSSWSGDRETGIPRLVLDESGFDHRPILLCDQIYTALMRDDLKQVIEEKSLTGFHFIKPEQYKSGKYGMLLDYD
jgi:hypothetical protein